MAGRSGRLGTARPGPGTRRLRHRTAGPATLGADRARPASASGSNGSRASGSTASGRRLEGAGRPARRVLAPVADRPLHRLPATPRSARRVAAIARTELGDRRPAAGGHWLKTLRSLDGVKSLVGRDRGDRGIRGRAARRVRRGRPGGGAGRPPRSEPSSCRGRTCGGRPASDKATGLTGSLMRRPGRAGAATDPVVTRCPTAMPTGARGEPPPPSDGRPAPRAPRTASRRRPLRVDGDVAPPRPRAVARRRADREGDARLRAELDELTRVKRPQIIARIRTAKEHGDLKENAEYHAAREEQSFLEGRVQAIEARLRSAVIVDAPAAGLARRPRVGRDASTTTARPSPTRSSAPTNRTRRAAGSRRRRRSGAPSSAATRATTSWSPRRPASAATGSSRSRNRGRSRPRAGGARERAHLEDRARRTRRAKAALEQRSERTSRCVSEGAQAQRAPAADRARLPAWGLRPACARPRTARPACVRPARACRGCSRRRSGRSAR